jgi:hypothetical protein
LSLGVCSLQFESAIKYINSLKELEFESWKKDPGLKGTIPKSLETFVFWAGIEMEFQNENLEVSFDFKDLEIGSGFWDEQIPLETGQIVAISLNRHLETLKLVNLKISQIAMKYLLAAMKKWTDLKRLEFHHCSVEVSHTHPQDNKLSSCVNLQELLISDMREIEALLVLFGRSCTISQLTISHPTSCEYWVRELEKLANLTIL